MKARKLLMIPGPMNLNQRFYKQWELNESCGSRFYWSFRKQSWAYERSLKSLQANHLSLRNGHAGYGYDGCQPHWKGNVLVISSSYFGNRFKDILDRYGANTTILEAPLGENVPLEVIELELKPNIIKL
jgi:alanine-glyoxylate transaminase/serine-glyoxylate transaminase/serine-pyruvate transaminase